MQPENVRRTQSDWFDDESELIELPAAILSAKAPTREKKATWTNGSKKQKIKKDNDPIATDGIFNATWKNTKKTCEYSKLETQRQFDLIFFHHRSYK